MTSRPKKYASLYHSELASSGLISCDTFSARQDGPDRSIYYFFRNSRNPGDIGTTNRRQSPTLLGDLRLSFYMTIASRLKTAVPFGVHDIKQLGHQVRSSVSGISPHETNWLS